MGVARAQHHPVFAEGDRPQISIGREVPDREGRHKGLRSAARIMPDPEIRTNSRQRASQRADVCILALSGLSGTFAVRSLSGAKQSGQVALSKLDSAPGLPCWSVGPPVRSACQACIGPRANASLHLALSLTLPRLRNKVGRMGRVVDRMRPHPFALGQVIVAAVVGSATGLFFNLVAVVTFSAGLAAGAAVSSLICRWRPGFEAAGRKLWAVGSIAIPWS